MKANRVPVEMRRRGLLAIAAAALVGCSAPADPPAPSSDRGVVFYRAGLPPSERARVEAGRLLFLREFTAADGLGDGNGGFNGPSCVSCHLHPTVGGSGPVERMSCVFPEPEQPLSDVSGVLLHNLRGNAHVKPCPPGAERRIAPPVYGLGWTLQPELVERLAASFDARPATAPACRLVRDEVTNQHLLLGLQPFTTDLREFVGHALRHEIGLTVQTGGLYPDFEHDTDATPDPEVTREQFDELVAFLTWLDFPPRTAEHPTGEAVFERIGCGSCHTRDVVPGFEQQWRSFGVTDLGPHFAATGLRDHGDAPGERVIASLRGYGDKVRRGTRLHTDHSQSDLDASLRDVHQGAALPSSEAYFRLSAAERDELRQFLETL